MAAPRSRRYVVGTGGDPREAATPEGSGPKGGNVRDAPPSIATSVGGSALRHHRGCAQGRVSGPRNTGSNGADSASAREEATDASAEEPQLIMSGDGEPNDDGVPPQLEGDMDWWTAWDRATVWQLGGDTGWWTAWDSATAWKGSASR
jgi:hypothetical protein